MPQTQTQVPPGYQEDLRAAQNAEAGVQEAARNAEIRDAAMAFAQVNPQAAVALAGVEAPSRRNLEAAGIDPKKLNAADRRAFAENLRYALRAQAV